MVKHQTLKEILSLLKSNKKMLAETYGISDIAVFGSYVKETQKQRSDLDIMVELGPEHRTYDNFMELKFFLERITRRKIDLVIKESIRKELKPAIFKEAVHV